VEVVGEVVEGRGEEEEGEETFSCRGGGGRAEGRG